MIPGIDSSLRHLPPQLGQLGVQGDGFRADSLLQGNSGGLLAISIAVALVLFLLLGVDYYRDWKRRQRVRRWKEAGSARSS